MSDSRQYIQNNFTTMPRGVLLQLLAQLNSTDLVQLCASSPALREHCKKIGAYKQKHYQLMPLSKAVYTPQDQLSLNGRGFSTQYNCTIDNSGLEGKVQFGVPENRKTLDMIRDEGMEPTRTHVIFSIRGLPAEKDTRVFVIGSAAYAYEDDYDHKTLVFASEDDAWNALKEAIKTKAHKIGIVKVEQYGQSSTISKMTTILMTLDLSMLLHIQTTILVHIQLQGAESWFGLK